MFTVKTLPEFDQWLNAFKDPQIRLRLARRLDKAARGIFGDIKPVGDGVWEMREHFGAGYRLYYVQRGNTLIVMLAGGDKSTQTRDIAQAQQRARTLEE
ncbi:MAG: type II toxin-antitoxin system RelE/ParE family toxin [Cardiobacteriaceae bacterium]|nr:type II toxin-antitoxin system RelE/ParE family toxin [Cardiobacteriaceae bacterium]